MAGHFSKKKARLLLIKEYHTRHRFTSALDILPEEIWLLVLDGIQTSHSVDIRSILLALPELNAAFHKRKTSWLFGEVFPNILREFCGMSEHVLPCRQVCKRWRTSIDSFLENHPQQRPFKSGAISSPALSDRDFTYDHLQTFEFLKISTAENINKYVQAFQGNSSTNPFIGRVVKLTRRNIGEAADDRVIEGGQFDVAEQFLDSSIAFLKLFGHHIWYISLDFGSFLTSEYDVYKVIFSKIVDCLRLIPNVRSLGIGFEFEDFDSTRLFTHPYHQTLEPLQLSHLETIQIIKKGTQETSATDQILRILCSGSHIRKLEIPLKFWRPRYKKYFSNVSEIYVDSIFSQNYKIFPNMLKQLPCLKKLHFKPSHFSKPMHMHDLFRNLKPLDLEKLEIVNYHATLKLIGPKPNSKCLDFPVLTTIKYLRVYDAKQLGFEYLMALPSLEHLHLFWHDRALMNDFRWKSRRGWSNDSLTSQVRSYMYLNNVPGNVDLWQSMPSLKLITIDEGSSITRYARECRNKPFKYSSQLQGEATVYCRKL